MILPRPSSTKRRAFLASVMGGEAPKPVKRKRLPYGTNTGRTRFSNYTPRSSLEIARAMMRAADKDV